MEKRLALTKDGKMTYCTASEENIGKGRCNNIAHQKNNESVENFCKRIENSKTNEIKNLKTIDKIKLIKSKDTNDDTFDVLINDKDWFVRWEVASQGYGLDKLINDSDVNVRVAVAEQGYGLNKLVNDEDPNVRVVVARQGYDLDKFVNDEDEFVRAAVASQGYSLDKLVNDENNMVSEIAREFLINHDITIEEYIKNKEYWCNKTMSKDL